MKPLLCIYHGNCADGFGAACIVRRFCAQNDVEVEFYPGVYQRDPPDVSDRHVILVDFSYKKPVLLAMGRKAKSVLIIDHHKTAIEDLERFGDSFENKTFVLPTWRDSATNYGHAHVFDLERSGAGLAWDFFFPDLKRPALINAIEDRDLWRFKLPYTREIQAALFSYPYDFELWDELIERTNMPLGLNNFIDEGQAIERKHFKDIDELLLIVTRPMRFRVPADYKWNDPLKYAYPSKGDTVVVPVANLPYTMVSDAGHRLCKRSVWGHIAADDFDPTPMNTSPVNPYGHAFAACYYDGADGRNFSLRSEDDGADVGAIAKLYGGGGHPHAAGFRVPYDQLAQFDPLAVDSRASTTNTLGATP